MQMAAVSGVGRGGRPRGGFIGALGPRPRGLIVMASRSEVIAEPSTGRRLKVRTELHRGPAGGGTGSSREVVRINCHPSGLR